MKRGDTLFYIAWITGNDFRDLAQLNNVEAPYALEVGRRSVGNDGYAAYAQQYRFCSRRDAQNSSVKPAQKIHRGGFFTTCNYVF